MVAFENQWDLKDVKLSIPRDTRPKTQEAAVLAKLQGPVTAQEDPICRVQRTNASKSPQTHCKARCMTETRMQAFTIGNEEGGRHSFTSQVTDQVQWAQMAKRVGMGSSNCMRTVQRRRQPGHSFSPPVPGRFCRELDLLTAHSARVAIGDAHMVPDLLCINALPHCRSEHERACMTHPSCAPVLSPPHTRFCSLMFPALKPISCSRAPLTMGKSCSVLAR